MSDVANSGDGTLYVALPRRMQVVTCDAITHAEQRAYGVRDVPYVPGDALYNAPAGVAVAADGAITLVESDGQRVVRRAADGSLLWQFGAAGIAAATTATSPTPPMSCCCGRSQRGRRHR